MVSSPGGGVGSRLIISFFGEVFGSGFVAGFAEAAATGADGPVEGPGVTGKMQ